MRFEFGYTPESLFLSHEKVSELLLDLHVKGDIFRRNYVYGLKS